MHTAVVKILIIDVQGQYLTLTRSNHPQFGNDTDIPGGEVEPNEAVLDALLREVLEETGLVINRHMVREVFAGTQYSAHGTTDILFMAQLTSRPEIRLSWEHSAYSWLDRAIFLELAASANDYFMHMVSDVLQGTVAQPQQLPPQQ